jgi:hypothetical protein
MRIGRFIRVPLGVVLGTVSGYTCYGLLLLLRELYHSFRYGLSFDWEWVVHTGLYPLGISLLLIGRWREFWQMVNVGDALCYGLILFWIWWFLRRFRQVKDPRD